MGGRPGFDPVPPLFFCAVRVANGRRVLFLPVPRPHHSSAPGFTLLEVCLAVAIALIVLAAAIPNIASALRESDARRAFGAFDSMVREARERSRAEGRNYVMVWGRERAVLLRPEAPLNRTEAGGVRRWEMAREGALVLRLPAALVAGPDAIWTFWADGVCEPAEVRYSGAGGGWLAVYNALTGEAEVRYD